MDCHRLTTERIQQIEMLARTRLDEGQQKQIAIAVDATDSEDDPIAYCAKLTFRLAVICPCHASLVCVAAMDSNAYSIDQVDALRLTTGCHDGSVSLDELAVTLGACDGLPLDPWRHS